MNEWMGGKISKWLLGPDSLPSSTHQTLRIFNIYRGVPMRCRGCNLKYILFLAYVSPLKYYHYNLQGNTLVCIKIY
jgi:hypothetical protein